MGPFDAEWVYAAIQLSTPLILASMGETISERAGVINIGLEGYILAGAFFAFLIAWLSGSLWLGLAAGMLAGAALAAIMAFLVIDTRADQIVVGVGLIIFALGITTFLDQEIFAGGEEIFLDRPGALPIPLLSRIPLIGPLLFNQMFLVYVAYLSVPTVWFVFFRTKAGIAIRAIGEVPEAADTAGVSVRMTRWMATLAAGALGGLAGAYLSVGELGLFIENMSAGRGFIAIAAVFFGKWHPLGVAGACLVFGAAEALQLRLQAQPVVPAEVWLAIALAALAALAYELLTRRGRALRRPFLAGALTLLAAGAALYTIGPAWKLPTQLWLSLPYLFTLAVLAGFVGRAHQPRALAVPYRRGGE